MGEIYFVVQITKTSDSDTYATLITPRNDLNDAKMLWHQICASVYATPNITHAIVQITDAGGNNVIVPETIIPAS